MRSSALTCYVLGLCAAALTIPSEGSYRLPLEVIPYSYDITLIPYLDEGEIASQFTFFGVVSILVRAHRQESSITLHASDMEIENLPLVTEMNSGQLLNVTHITRDEEREFLVIHLDSYLIPEADYNLTITYHGNIQKLMLGFFRTFYDNNGSMRYLAATQFEQLGARLAFPCFDEPALKATFNVTIGSPAGRRALSNMPLAASVEPDPSGNDLHWDIFKSSVKMSTYLVAFIVSDFQAVNSGMYGVWSKPSTVRQGEFALSISPEVISIMTEITGIPYALPKLDQVAVPDFPGGMENWGLVVYGEEFLLLNEYVLNFTIAEIVSHELAHQWFGDLVTFNWWKYTWLNEGFASFFEYFIPDKMFPEWGMADILTEFVQFTAMAYDSSKTSHPLSADVETPHEIAMMFDTISYSKGACVLKMLAHTITFNTFYKGLSRYLKARAYSDAVPDDLFAGIQQAVDEDGVLPEGPTIKAIMDTWTLQSGYPVVTVTRDYSARTATVQQALFLDDSDVEASNSSWYIPLTYTTSEELQFNDTRPSLWMNAQENVTLQNLPGENQWIILNIQAMGYFRINYDAANWKLLNDQLHTDKEKIPELNRAQLQDDSQHFVQAGLLDWDTALSITSYLRLETDPAPWMSAFRGLTEIFNKLGGSPVFPALQSYYLKLMERFYESVGIEPREGDSYMVHLVRPQLLHWACMLGHEHCIESSVRRVARMQTDSSHSRSSTQERGVLYCAAVRGHGEAAWKWLWGLYKNSDDVKQRKEVLQALGCTSQPKTLKRLLNLVLTEDSGLKPEDRLNVFSAACNGRDSLSCDITLKFLASSFTELEKVFGEYESIALILVRIASRIKTPQQLHMFQLIINKHRQKLTADKQVISTAAKIAKENVDWVKTKGAEISRWLCHYNNQSGRCDES